MLWKQNELLNALNIQLKLLSSHCKNFDQGDEDFGIEICTKLRVLLHQKNNSSTALFTYLDLFKQNFVDTAKEHISYKMVVGGVIVSNQFLLIEQATMPPIDILLNTPNCYREDPVYNEITFDDWWNKNVIIYIGTKRSFTRKALVVDLFTNRLGGGHIGHNVVQSDIDIFNLENDTIGFTINNNNGEIVPHDHSPFLFTCRQIAHELFETLRRHPNLSLKAVDDYFKWVEHYNFYINNSKAKWSEVRYNENSVLNDRWPGVQVKVIFKSVIAAFGISYNLNACKSIDISKIEFMIVLDGDGKIIIKDLDVNVKCTSRYKENDFLQIVAKKNNGTYSPIFLLNDTVIYESLNSISLPVFPSFWYFPGISISDIALISYQPNIT